MNWNELNACPFCGSEAKSYHFDGEKCYVECQDCGARGPVISAISFLKEFGNEQWKVEREMGKEAKQEWNERAYPARAQWLIKESEVCKDYTCDNCYFSYTERDPDAPCDYHYCPNCGAEMTNSWEE